MIPACKSGGCPIEDLASDEQLNVICLDFIRYKKLNRNNTLHILQEQVLKRSGFYYDVDLLCDAEDIYSKAIENESKKQRAKHKR